MLKFGQDSNIRLLNNPYLFRLFLRFYRTVTGDHYKNLGLDRNATTKEIKVAYYELSKKYHPDMNRQNSDKFAKEFQDVKLAYETLASEDKKRAYDASLAPERSLRAPKRPHAAKNYVDIDIDYKDMEHFQRNNRKRMNRQHEIPEYFRKYVKIDSMGDFTNLDPLYSKYKDSKAYQREQEEKRLAEELEELRRRERYPIPNLDALFNQVHEDKRKKKGTHLLPAFGIGSGIISLIILFIYRF